jgi:hypothetical protein
MICSYATHVAVIQLMYDCIAMGVQMKDPDLWPDLASLKRSLPYGRQSIMPLKGWHPAWRVMDGSAAYPLRPSLFHGASMRSRTLQPI